MQLESEGDAQRGQLHLKPGSVVSEGSRPQDHAGEPAYMVWLSPPAIFPWKEAVDVFLVAM